ncbi:hypothetical protein BGZ80_001984, partial [Entomortierella chlamydospora]
SDVCAGEIGAAGFGSVQGAFGGEGDDRAVAVETTVAVVTAGGYVAGSDTQGFALDSAFDFELDEGTKVLEIVEAAPTDTDDGVFLLSQSEGRGGGGEEDADECKDEDEMEDVLARSPAGVIGSEEPMIDQLEGKAQ